MVINNPVEALIIEPAPLTCKICKTKFDARVTLNEFVQHLSNSHNITLKDYVRKLGVMIYVEDSEQEVTKLFDVNVIRNKEKETIIKKAVKVKAKKEMENMFSAVKKSNPDKALIPEVDEKYYLGDAQHELVKRVLAYDGFLVALLTGDSGTGKTSCVSQICAREGLEMIRVNLTGTMQERHLFQDQNFDKDTKVLVYEDKPIVTAMKKGVVLLIDEFSNANPHLNSAFFRLFEEGEYLLQNGEVLKAAKGFKIILTDNRIGNPSFFKFHGTFEQSSALIRRINTTIVFEKVSAEVVIDFMSKYYSKIKDYGFNNKIKDFVNLLRDQYEKGNLNFPINIGDIKNICFNYSLFECEEAALKFGFLNKLTEQKDKDVPIETWKRQFGEFKKYKPEVVINAELNADEFFDKVGSVDDDEVREINEILKGIS